MHSEQKKILVVDDDPDILSFIQALLEDAGYTAITMDRGENLKKLARNDIPGMIVLDMLLAGSDGRKLISHLKSQDDTKDIPIILLSAHPSAEKEARAYGADDFMAKPFEMDDFLAMVAKYV
ncbi:MAG: hypothetical protein NVSMB33_07040 [Ktedonobacteraceae bacterium]